MPRRYTSHGAPRRRAGFTLLELSVALALTGGILLVAWVMLAQLVDARDRMSEAVNVASARANGERVLRAIVDRTTRGGESTIQYRGNASEVSFASWCDTPAGYLARCRATLAIDQRGDTSTLFVAIDDGERNAVWRGGAPAVFRYGFRGVDGMRWISSWASGLVAPVALSITAREDTLVLRIGGSS